MATRSEVGDDKYIEALEERVAMLKQIIKLKDHKIADMEANHIAVPDGGVTDMSLPSDPSTAPMALVPETPDGKMLDAGAWALSRIERLSQAPYREIAMKVWKAMVEAS